MRCMRCGAENAADRRYCGSCGGALALRCPRCGFVNDPGTSFCGGCGAVLAGPSSRPADDAGIDAAPERRQVAVLFVDLAGYTRLTSELGAEDTRALLDEFFATVDGVVERHGGTVDKHIGDCVMALFGAPVAHGDDVTRAVRAALAIPGAVAGLSVRLGRDLQVHMGVAGGEVVAGGTGGERHRTYTVTGDTVNFAARLTDLARAGEVLVSDAIRLALGDLARLEDHGEVSLRGIAAPARVHRLLGLREPAAGDESGPLIGRRAELEQLTAFLERAGATGRGEVALLRGEAGIGKTRLVREMQRHAGARGFACHAALVLDFGTGEGRDAVRTLARSLLGVVAAEEAAREAAAAAALRDGLIGTRLQPFLHDLLDLPLPPAARQLVDAMAEGPRRQARQETLAALVRARAVPKPLLLTVEDIHWADPSTLEDLAACGEAIADHPVVLLMTTRRDGDPIGPAWLARAGSVPSTTIDLHPLRQAEAWQLAGHLMVGGEDAAVERCVARAQGNPLFLEQLLRHLRERHDEAVPATVQTLVQARIDRLGPSDRGALRAASVLGQSFSLEALRATLRQDGYDPTQLVERLLVRPAGNGFLFAHALIRDAVYDLLLRTQRRELHRRAAAYFADRDAALHARHLDRAEDPAAARAYASAAKHEADLYRAEAALELASRGLEIAADQADRFRLACLVGGLLLDVGRPEAPDAFATALELARDGRERCRARLGLAAAMRLADRLEEALAQLDSAQVDASALALHGELSRIHHLRGNLLFPAGRVEACASEHERALASARVAASPELEALALGGLGDAEYARGRMLSALDAFARCCELASRHGVGRIEAANKPMVAITRGYELDPPGTLRDAEAALALALRVGHHRAAIIALHAACFASVSRLDLAGARTWIEQAHALTLQIGARRFEAENVLMMASIAWLDGRRDEATELSAQAMKLSRETAVSYMGPCVLGFIARVSRDPAGRRDAIAEGESLLAQGAVSHNFLWFRRDAIEAALAAKDWDEAARHAAELERYAAVEPSPWTRFYVARERALAAHGRAPRDAAALAEIGQLRRLAIERDLALDLPALDAALAPEAQGGA